MLKSSFSYYCKISLISLTFLTSTIASPTIAQDIDRVREVKIENDWRSSDPDVPFSELVKISSPLGYYYVVFDKNFQKYGGWFGPGSELGVITRFTYDDIGIFLYRKEGCDGILGCLGGTQTQQGGETIDIILGGDTFTLYGDGGMFPVTPEIRKAFQNLQGNPKMQIVINKTTSNDIGGGTVNQLKRLYSIKDPLGDKSINSQIALIPVNQEEPKLEKLIASVIPSVVKIQTNYGDGTGFILTKDGLIVTNRHVVSRSDKAEVTFYDKTKIEATVVRRDVNADIAIVSISDRFQNLSLKPLPICYQQYPNLGESVIAIGNPLSLSNTITRGIVSGIRETESQTLIQTDASINPGNSGGPLINKYGEVVGVVNARIAGIGIQGLGFAVSIINALENLEIELGKSNFKGELNKCGNPIAGTEVNNPQEPEVRPLPLLEKDLPPLPPLEQ
ncbi:S1C family serine protease [Cyanobacterium aponinum]|uniref:Trypsin-like serine protease n=1 Tax=Cyanobacterium aponinum 0216 TaxID=2676140 RepID=A0A844GLR1_9CHRO|nr:trypsin-like peptidase domain-containing protein [Cyanobacterium aponinum]MTF37514.1 trypsin-like serine protease [Cyanobacterium aponinum 0216]